MPTPQKPLAVLIDHVDQLSHGYETELRAGFMRACAQANANLLLVAGRTMRPLEPWGSAANGIYDLMHPSCIDGLILVSSGIMCSCTLTDLQAICREYA